MISHPYFPNLILISTQDVNSCCHAVLLVHRPHRQAPPEVGEQDGSADGHAHEHRHEHHKQELAKGDTALDSDDKVLRVADPGGGVDVELMLELVVSASRKAAAAGCSAVGVVGVERGGDADVQQEIPWGRGSSNRAGCPGIFFTATVDNVEV